MANRNLKSDLSIPWPFAPAKSDLNNDTNLLKCIAMFTMFIDHAGKMLFPQHIIMRIIGRIAFPIYAYCIAAGCVYTKNVKRYLRRIVFIGLISQPIYAEALGHATSAMRAVSFAEAPGRAVLNYYISSWNTPSIMLTLGLGLLVVWSIRSKEPVYTLALLLLCFLIERKINYGMKGILLIVLFYLFIMKWWVSLPIIAAYMLWWGMQGSGYVLFGARFGIQTFAMMALPVIYFHTHSGLKVNKWVFYWFYPAHLLAIYLLNR